MLYGKVKKNQQCIYLNFNETVTKYQNHNLKLVVEDVVIKSPNISAHEITRITSKLNSDYKTHNVKFSSNKKDFDNVEKFSTIFVGSCNDFERYGNFAGLAEAINTGNEIETANAFVFSNKTQNLYKTIFHEAGHLIGTLDHGGMGLNRYADYDDYFKYVYVEDLVRTGHITRLNNNYTVVSNVKFTNQLAYKSEYDDGIRSDGRYLGDNIDIVDSYVEDFVTYYSYRVTMTIEDATFYRVAVYQGGVVQNSTLLNEKEDNYNNYMGHISVMDGGTVKNCTVNGALTVSGRTGFWYDPSNNWELDSPFFDTNIDTITVKDLGYVKVGFGHRTTIANITFEDIDYDSFNAGRFTATYAKSISNVTNARHIDIDYAANVKNLSTNLDPDLNYNGNLIIRGMKDDDVTIITTVSNVLGRYVTLEHTNSTDVTFIEDIQIMDSTVSNVTNIGDKDIYTFENDSYNEIYISNSTVDDFKINQQFGLKSDTEIDNRNLYYADMNIDNSTVTNAEIYFTVIDDCATIDRDDDYGYYYTVKLDEYKAVESFSNMTLDFGEKNSETTVVVADCFFSHKVNNQWITSNLSYDGENFIFENGDILAYDDFGDQKGQYVGIIYEIVPFAPEIEISVSNTEITNQDVIVTAVVTDDATISKQEYKIGDSGIWADFVNNENIAVSDNGTVYFRATDVDNNTTTESITITNIDKTPPDAPVVTASTTPTASDVVVTATFASDSVLNQYRYAGDSRWKTYTEQGVEVSYNRTVEFRSQDEVGNYSEVTSYEVTNIDYEGPEIMLFAERDKTTNAITISADFYDQNGVDSKEYTIHNYGEPTEDMPPVDGDSKEEMPAETWQPYTDPIIFEGNQAYVELKATDSLGNENLGGFEIFLEAGPDMEADNIPPTIVATSEKTDDGFAISASFEDNNWLYFEQYKVGDDGRWMPYYYEPIIVAGNTTVYFRVSDNSFNSAYTQIVATDDSSALDSEKPIITITPSATDLTNQDVVISATFEDNVDIATQEYKITESGTWTNYTEAITVAENTTVYFKATDSAGNETVSDIIISNIDKVAPVISSVSASTNLTTNQDVTITIVATDNVGVTKYQLKDGEGWVDLTDNTYSATTNDTYQFRVVDSAGNSAEQSIVVSNIDKTLPTITASADIVTATDSSVKVTANFIESATTKEYSLDGSNWLTYNAEISFTENGVVYFRALDENGNTMDQIEYKVYNITSDDYIIDDSELIIDKEHFGDSITMKKNSSIYVDSTTVKSDSLIIDDGGRFEASSNSNVKIGSVNIVKKGSLRGGDYNTVMGTSSASGVSIEVADVVVNGRISGGSVNSNIDGDIKINVTGSDSTKLWTGNFYGGGVASQNISIAGDITATINGGNYSGIIYGGSRAQSGASVTTTGTINLTVTGITHQNNPVFGNSTSAWIVGAGQAIGANLTTEDVNISVIGSTIGYIVGGAQAETGGVANVGNISITIADSTITHNIFGAGYANGNGESIVNGDVNVNIDSTTEATIQGDIYLGGNNVGGMGQLNVSGDATITFTGNGDNLNFMGLVSGLGKGNSNVEGKTAIDFKNFAGEFCGYIEDMDEVNFAGDTVMTMSNSYDVSTIGFDLSSRTTSEVILEDTSINLVGDERIVNLIINETAFNYNLMDVSDEELTGVICKVFDTLGTELGNFNLLEETLAVGSYDISFKVDSNDILIVKSEG